MDKSLSQTKLVNTCGGIAVEFIDLKLLKPHEKTDQFLYKSLFKDIKRNQFVKPIIVDLNSHVILDGHHRTQILKDLGYSVIPVFLVDYQHRMIEIFPRNKKIFVSKELVLEKALKSDLFPPKTTRHIVGGLEDIKISLDLCKKKSIECK